MVLGLVAARLVTATLGASLYTWTSIVGIILAGICVGSGVGGRLADRFHPRRTLAVLFGLASAACVAVIVLHNLVAGWIWLWELNWPIHVLLHVALLAFVPSLLLGAVAPVTVQMAAHREVALGRAAGGLCAWGAAGAIAGTFVTGFHLVPAYGCMAIVWSLGAALLGVALLYWTSCWALYLWAMVFATLAAMGMAPAEWAREAGVGAALRQADDPHRLYVNETLYSHIAIQQVSNRPDRRALWTNSLRRSETVIGEATRLHEFHTDIWAGVTHGLAADRRNPAMMVIGSGGYVFPRYLKAFWPESLVRVIEVDPGITEAAKEAFDLSETSTLETIYVAARHYLDRLSARGEASGREGRYDFIYIDTAGDGSTPFQWVTNQFNEKIAALLADDGVLMLSAVDVVAGGRFLGAVVATLEQTFSHVHVIASPVGQRMTRACFVVVAAQWGLDATQYLKDYDEDLKFRLLGESEIEGLKAQSGYLVLTDDYAPVEDFLSSVVREGARERLAHRHLREAERLQAAQRHEQGVQRYQLAARLDPSVALEVWSRIGDIRLAQDDLRRAAEAFRNAIACADEAGRQKQMLASAHMNLGIAFGKVGRKTEMRTHLLEAAKWFRMDLKRNPNSVVSWERLGDTLTLTGNLEGAAEAFDRAMVLEPANLAFYEKLAQVLEQQHRYDEAISVARRHVALLRELGRRDIARQIGAYIDFLQYQRVKHRR